MGGDFEEIEDRPCRHLWLGNVLLKVNKSVVETLFKKFGELESVRVFTGKTYAFVNYLITEDAIVAKKELDHTMHSSICGSKPLVIRF